MSELSIIIPFCNEFPQISFTIRTIAEQLLGKADFEIIAVDNYFEGPDCRKPDRGHDHIGENGKPVESHIKQVSQFHSWLKYVRYDERLSHWQAKNKGVEKSSGQFLWFMDAHVVPSNNSLTKMFDYYRKTSLNLNGTLSLPLAYHILERQRLIYQMDVDETVGRYHYTFKNFNGIDSDFDDGVFEVPVMSVCGMLMTREIFERIGGFPRTLGIYGGGENFVNYVTAITGVGKYIYPQGTLFHHGDKRGYNYRYDDFHKNRMTAVYLHADENTARLYAEHNFKTSPRRVEMILREIVEENREQKQLIEDHRTDELDSFLAFWMHDGRFVKGGRINE